MPRPFAAALLPLLAGSAAVALALPSSALPGSPADPDWCDEPNGWATFCCSLSTPSHAEACCDELVDGPGVCVFHTPDGVIVVVCYADRMCQETSRVCTLTPRSLCWSLLQP